MTDGINRAQGNLKSISDFWKEGKTFEDYKEYMKGYGFVCPECGELYNSRQFFGYKLFCKNGHEWENRDMCWSADG